MIAPASSDPIADSLQRDYGLQGTRRPLGGSGTNYLVESADGRRFTLKLRPADAADADGRAALESAVAAHVAASRRAVPLPRLVTTRAGDDEAAVVIDGRAHRLQVLAFVPGTPWMNAGPAAPDRLRALGSALGRLTAVLADFDHDAAGRTHAWDLTRAGQHRAHVPLVEDAARRALLDRAFQLHASVVMALAHLPHTVIHGDANDENILVEGNRVTGLIDLGDCLRNPTVCELAIALAYAMLDAQDPLAAGARVVEGYHAERPLHPDELEVLFPLVCGRLAVTVAVAAAHRRVDPDHPTWFVTEPRAWALLERLDDLAPVAAGRALASGTGTDPWADDGASIDALLARRHARISSALSTAYDEPLKMTRGRGQFLIADDGRPYLDLVNNVCHVGHCHPVVVEAGQRQMARLNTNTRYVYDGLTDYADRLCATLPNPLEVCFFVNSGTEANELALRLARAHTGRRDVLVVDGAYHGHTSSLIDVSPYKFMGKGGTGQPQPWVHVVPTPDGYRGTRRGTDEATGRAYGDDVGVVIARANGPVAAFLTETLLSCGGQIVPPPGWLATAFRHVRAAGGVCIADEVQTGFGRVGSHFWAFETQGVVPDVVVLGKPMGNGHPIGAVVTTRAIARSFETGMEFFSTFGGNPVSCAIGLAVLDVIRDEGLQRHALEVGRLFREGLEDLKSRHPLVGDVRGLGLFLGVELVRESEHRTPASAEASALVNRLRARGVLASTDGPDANVVKIKPPMVISEADVQMVLRILADELQRATNAAEVRARPDAGNA